MALRTVHPPVADGHKAADIRQSPLRAKGGAQPSSGLRSRSPLLPVLRNHRGEHRPCGPALSRRDPRLGERGCLVSTMQPPQRKPDSQGGRDETRGFPTSTPTARVGSGESGGPASSKLAAISRRSLLSLLRRILPKGGSSAARARDPDRTAMSRKAKGQEKALRLTAHRRSSAHAPKRRCLTTVRR